MVTYSFRRILRVAGLSSKRIIAAFKVHVKGGYPKNIWDPEFEYYQRDFSGQSFMVNPEELLLYSFKYSYKEVADYIGLASYRSQAEFISTGDKSLDLFHSPVDQDTINNNRLLKIEGDRIYFYYEESANRRNKLWLV